MDKRKNIYSIGFLMIALVLVIGVGVMVLKDVAEIPFELCENKTGLIINPEEDYIWYDCNKVNNITISLATVS